MHDFEEYKDAVMSDIQDPNETACMQVRVLLLMQEEIIAMLRKEADGIGYADNDGDRLIACCKNH